MQNFQVKTGGCRVKSRHGARRLAAAVAVGISLALGGCSFWSKDDNALAFQEEPADKLFAEAQAMLDEGLLAEAAKKFEEVERQHPYSPLARRAIVLSAYCHYETKDYVQAVEAGRRYVTLHPTGEEADYAQYLIGLAYYDQIVDVSRDQSASRNAFDALSEVVRRYPDSKYARAAQRKMNEARGQLAGKEMEVGRYYLRKNNYVAALNRFKSVVTDYQTTAHVEEALMRLTETYLAMGITSEAQNAAAILGHNYPTSQWYKDAYKLLQSGGLEPRGDAQSWLSKIWKATTGT